MSRERTSDLNTVNEFECRSIWTAGSNYRNIMTASSGNLSKSPSCVCPTAYAWIKILGEDEKVHGFGYISGIFECF
ncbi:hypothetical protein SG26_03065 [Haloarcula sp. CBA1115]|nr:hypothetical protein SG26_03065 [Haloarcula sp. CBA1115]